MKTSWEDQYLTYVAIALVLITVPMMTYSAIL